MVAFGYMLLETEFLMMKCILNAQRESCRGVQPALEYCAQRGSWTCCAGLLASLTGLKNRLLAARSQISSAGGASSIQSSLQSSSPDHQYSSGRAAFGIEFGPNAASEDGRQALYIGSSCLTPARLAPLSNIQALTRISTVGPQH